MPERIAAKLLGVWPSWDQPRRRGRDRVRLGVGFLWDVGRMRDPGSRGVAVRTHTDPAHPLSRRLAAFGYDRVRCLCCLWRTLWNSGQCKECDENDGRGLASTNGRMAERVGFEPTVPVRGRRFSRPVHSTALPPLRRIRARAEATAKTGSGPAGPGSRPAVPALPRQAVLFAPWTSGMASRYSRWSTCWRRLRPARTSRMSRASRWCMVATPGCWRAWVSRSDCRSTSSIRPRDSPPSSRTPRSG